MSSGTNVGSSLKHKKICNKSFHLHLKQQNKVAGSDFVLQAATEDCSTMPVQNPSLPVYPLSLLRLFSQTGICECVCWQGTEIKPLGSH